MRISDWSSDVCSFRSIGGAAGGTVTVPGGGTLDLGKLDAAAKKMEETTKKMQSREDKPIAPDALQAMLPARSAGWHRPDRKSMVSGKRVSDRGDPGVRRSITQKNTTPTITITNN